MEPISEAQIAQGIAPGNNWYVTWVFSYVFLLNKEDKALRDQWPRILRKRLKFHPT